MKWRQDETILLMIIFPQYTLNWAPTLSQTRRERSLPVVLTNPFSISPRPMSTGLEGFGSSNNYLFYLTFILCWVILYLNCRQNLLNSDFSLCPFFVFLVVSSPVRDYSKSLTLYTNRWLSLGQLLHTYSHSEDGALGSSTHFASSLKCNLGFDS